MSILANRANRQDLIASYRVADLGRRVGLALTQQFSAAPEFATCRRAASVLGLLALARYIIATQTTNPGPSRLNTTFKRQATIQIHLLR
jgi:hypothetical protein